MLIKSKQEVRHMKYPFVHQLGFVVDDMEKAMAEYGKIYGIKKWYRAAKRGDDEMLYRGERIYDPGFDLVMGYCGRTEIELITTAAKSSLYADFLQEREPGLHHISFFVNDLEKHVRQMQSLGFEVVQNGFMRGKTARTDYAYMARYGEGYGRIVEFSSSKLFGRIPLIRGHFNMWAAVLTGNAELIKER